MFTMKGNPIQLQGKMLQVGDVFPEFEVVDKNLQVQKSQSFSGVRVFASVPSVDTGICDMEIRNFNKKASELKGVKICVFSMDLPFAQNRWCGAAGVENVEIFSDYRKRSFGLASGTLIKDIELLARAVFVVNKDNKITYVEYVKEVSSHPDYDKLYEAVEKEVKMS